MSELAAKWWVKNKGSQEHRRRIMGGDTSITTSSSGEEDGDFRWKEVINSVATTTTYTGFNANNKDDGYEADYQKPKKLTHYQIQAQKLLDDIVESSIEIVKTDKHVSHEDSKMEEGGIRLFKRAPPGIKFDHVDELRGPRKKPTILRGPEIDEKSKKFRHKVESVVVNGLTIIAAASDACQKAQAEVEAKHEATKAAAKREEERVAALKKIRGERWLPSMAKEMQTKSQR